MSTVSVVLCTCNGERFLREQMESLLRQKRLPDEIVVADDASSDTTLNILRHDLARARDMGVGIRLIAQSTNVGVVKNFSRALMQARGEIIFLCDQDDVWHPDKLAAVVGKFDRDPGLMLVGTDARLVDAAGKALAPSLYRVLALKEQEIDALSAGRGFEVLLRRSLVTGATAAFRRRLLDFALPVAAGWLHDEWLAIMASVLGRVLMLDQKLVDYRQHGANQVGMRPKSLADRWNDLVRPRRAYFQLELERIDVLLERLIKLERGSSPTHSPAVAERRSHIERRVAIGAKPMWARIPSIVREALAGGYARHATGAVSIIRDLLRYD